MRRVLTLAWVAMLAVLGLPGLSYAETTGSFATLHSLDGERVVLGGIYRAGVQTIAVSGAPDSVIQVDLSNPPSASENYRIRFAAPQGQALAVGTYNDARDFESRSAAQAAVEITRDGSAPCGGPGSFEVLDLAPDLSHFWIAWERKCTADWGGEAFGEIRYNMPIDPDLFVSAGRILWPQLGYSAQDRYVGIPLTVTGANPVTFQKLSISGPGASAFGVSNDYCTTLEPDTSCAAFVTYHPTLVGRREATLTITDSTTAGTHTVTLVDPGLAVDDPALLAAAGSPPDPATNVEADAEFGSVTLHWTNPTTVDWADTVVRMLPGTRAPSSVSDGVGLYAGRDTTTRVDNLTPGTAYSFAVFSRDAEGLIGAPTTRTMPGVQVTLGPQPPRRGYRGQVVLTGRVLDALTGYPVEYMALQAIATNPRTGQVVATVAGRTAYGGGYQIPVNPAETLRWTVRVHGDTQHLGGISPPATSVIKAIVKITPMEKVTAKAGKTFKIVGRVQPIITSEPLLLQELVKNKWKTLAKQKPDRTGATTFKVKPKKGKHLYRVYRGDLPATEGAESSTLTVKAS